MLPAWLGAPEVSSRAALQAAAFGLPVVLEGSGSAVGERRHAMGMRAALWHGGGGHISGADVSSGHPPLGLCAEPKVAPSPPQALSAPGR